MRQSDDICRIACDNHHYWIDLAAVIMPETIGSEVTTMPFRLGPPELLIILGIVVVLFGVGRIGKIGKELGSGIRSFREGLKDDAIEPEANQK
jgi:sec-independent protein translocase protein TatA